MTNETGGQQLEASVIVSETTARYLVRSANKIIDSVNQIYAKVTNERALYGAAYFECRLDTLRELQSDFRTVHREVLTISLTDATLKANYWERDAPSLFDDAYTRAFTKLRQAQIDSTATTMQQPQCKHAEIDRVTKDTSLPKIQLPTFSGRFVEWPSFKEVFVSRIHKNERLNDLEKLHYLKATLTDEAADDVRHLNVVSENYHVVWDMLEKRYENKRVLFSYYMDLFEQQTTFNDNDVTALRRFIQTTRSCFNAIKSLGIDFENHSEVLAYLIIRKLPKSVRAEWERHLRSKQHIPKVDEVLILLDEIQQMMITSSTNRATSSSSSTNHENSKSKSRGSTTSSEKRGVHSLVTGKKESKCPVCEGPHVTRECSSFQKSTVDERRRQASKLKLCFNCLGFNHTVNDCKSTRTCLRCGSRHHTLLHMEVNPNASPFTPSEKTTSLSAATIATTSNQNISTAVSSKSNNKIVAATNTDEEVMLVTALVNVWSNDGQKFTFRALIDQCSHESFITEDVVQLLRLPKTKSLLGISSLNNPNSTSSKYHVSFTIGSRHDSFSTYSVRAYGIQSIVGMLPQRQIPKGNWPHLDDLMLADPHYLKPSNIDMLLGGGIYSRILRYGVKRGESADGPIAQETTLGWIVSGPADKQSTASAAVFTTISRNDDHEMLERFWQLEEIENENELDDDDQWCEQHYQQTHERRPDGTYLVRLPFRTIKDPTQQLGASRQIAINRFRHTEQRLARDNKLKVAYADQINDYVKLKQMTVVTTTESDHQQIDGDGMRFFNCCYLPHHAVVKESSSTTKVRVVFDASAKTTNEKSLNEILLPGPALQNDLPAVLLNWRKHRYVFMADIQKMYRCIAMHQDDAQFQRILWRDDPAKPFTEYACNTVMFGTASAPFLAIRTMLQLATDEQNNFPLAVDVVRNEMYVDDICSGRNSVHEALQTQQQLIDMLKSGGFELRKWAANCAELLEPIPSEHREESKMLTFDHKSAIRALGIYWSPETDSFHFQSTINISNEQLTRRQALSFLARIYDPIGFLNPVITMGKILNKQLPAKLSWDDKLPEDINSAWIRFLGEFESIKQLHINRWLQLSDDEPYQLHIFCDASKNAYSTVAYLRTKQPGGRIVVNIFMAKSKVTPRKQVTIPRLELCAALLSTRMFEYLQHHANLKFDGSNTFFWSDSMITIAWISKNIENLKIFVANRVRRIRAQSQPKQWHHVNGKDNPADLSSRGIFAKALINNSLWWTGPHWLSEGSDKWPMQSTNDDVVQDDIKAEMKVVMVNICASNDNFINEIVSTHSSYNRLIRSFAFVRRFIRNCRVPKHNRNLSPLSTNEVDESLMFIIASIHSVVFAPELSALENHQTVPDKSKLLSLNPMIDENYRLLRMKGRLRQSNICYNEKYPIILPSSHHFTYLAIEHSHHQTLHGGNQLTLTHLRHKFWIMNSRNSVRFVLHRCKECFKHKPIVSNQLMGDLPAHRVNPSQVFASVGVDFAGPFQMTPSRGRGITSTKGYVAVFICLSVKAIHLEAVSDLSSEAFRAALNRFIGRRGLCHDIYSDCGTNFVGANKLLKRDKIKFHQMIDDEIIPFLTTHGISWHFIPPASPHFGGLWEAAVKAMKHHLQRTIGSQRLTFEEMSTILCRIEACLNSRPLCPQTEDPNDFSALTPGHFLTGKALIAPPEPTVDDMNPSTRWHHCQRLSQEFWRRWRAEFLVRLQQRPKWLKQKQNVKINDLVLIKDERLPSTQWALGRIIALHPGEDDLVRVVTIKTQAGELKRPIQKVCLLPHCQPMQLL